MIQVIYADIINQTTDAIVNAANEMLLAGSGISGAIHAAAGRHLELECAQIGRCPTGEACITSGYKLKARYVIHAVAPKYWDGTRNEARLLRKTYRSIYEIALKHGLKSLSIPAIGTGIYRFPLEEATKIAFQEAMHFEKYLSIIFVCFDEKTFQVYQQEAQKYSNQK